MKRCSKCKEVKAFDEFSRESRNKNGLYSWCKECIRVAAIPRQRKYRKNNPEKARESNKQWRKNNPEKAREYNRKWKDNNREKVRAMNTKWAQNNKEWCQEYQQKYYQRNKKDITQRNRKRYYNDPAYKLREIVRHEINHRLKNGKGGESILPYVDWSSFEELKEHIENQWEEGMTWDNHARDGWHIDHIIPQSVLLDGVESMDHPNFRKCWSLENLQPLWAKDNRSKSNTIL